MLFNLPFHRYCVKPNSGVVDPRNEVAIAVSLQPFEYDPAEKNKHKFMVQSMFAPDGDINQDTLWKEVDQNELMDSKLRCVFAMPPGEEKVGVAENGMGAAQVPAPAPAQPAPAVKVGIFNLRGKWPNIIFLFATQPVYSQKVCKTFQWYIYMFCSFHQ